MKIEVNNKPCEIHEGSTLSSLLETLKTKPVGIAFAVNNKVIKKEDWGGFILTEGVKVTMIKAVCGG